MHPFQIVNVTVVKTGPFGAVVKLSDGTTGFIRPEEFSWDDRPITLEAGEQFPAKVLESGRRHNRNVLLSKRLAELDPWEDIKQQYNLGDLVDIQIINMLAHELVVELKPGIQGIVQETDFVPARIEYESINEIFWLGDHTKALIKRIDIKHRYMQLSIKDAYEIFDKVTFGELGHKLSKKITESQSEKYVFRPDIKWTQQSVHLEKNSQTPILIVDDNETLLRTLNEQLKFLNYPVTLSHDGANSLTGGTFNLDDHQVLLIDIDMPDRTGTKIVEEYIRHGFDSSRIIFMTGLTLEGNRFSEISKMNCAGVLLKPFPLHRLEECFDHVLSGKHLPDDLDMLSLVQEDFGETIHSPDDESVTPPVSKLTNELNQYVESSCIIIFKMDPDTLDTEIVESCNFDDSQFEKHKYGLPHSPVKDAIVRGEIINPGYYQANKNKFKNLASFIDFSDCIGLPVWTFGKRYHAIFFFKDKGKGGFTKRDRNFAKLGARLCGICLERKQLQQQLEDQLPFVNLGHTSASIEHELNNQLSIVEGTHSNIHTLLKSLEKIEAPELQKKLSEAQAATSTMKEIVKDLTNVVSKGALKSIDLNRIIYKILERLKLEIKNSHVIYNTLLDEDLPRIKLINVQIEQILFNIILNAIQHLKSCDIDNRVLTIKSYFKDEQKSICIIEVSDNGWGIHASHWERIFDAAFTTREKGTGMGLYICKDFAKKLGIDIRIKKSYVLFGTTFSVEIPIQSELDRN